jgi:hypothetical protein
MANANLTSTTEVLNTRLWAGVGEDDTSWLQTPMGSNSVTGTISLGIVDLVITDGDAAATYDLALTTNPIVGSALIGILGLHNTTTAGGNDFPVAGNISTNTLLKFLGSGSDGDTIRMTFLYR